MTSEFRQRLASVDRTTLTPLVRRVLERDRAEVLTWRRQPLEGGFGRSYGVHRFQGQARADSETLDWSLILKATGPAAGSQDPTDLDYWKREALAYQSGLLDALSGDLVAPRCIEAAEYPDQALWLWLEDVAGQDNAVWPLERYGLAARNLGQFNGAYLAGKPIPDVPWLSSGQLAQWLARGEAGISQMPQLNRHPLFAGLLPGDGLERSLRLWAQRQRLLAMLEQLPRSLCHHDAFRRNLFARQGPDGRAETVAIDWDKLGTGWIGKEIVALFATSLIFVEIDLDWISELDGLIFSGYLDGLRDAGWCGDPRWARFGYAATAALISIAGRAYKWPRVAQRAAALPPGAEPPRLLNAGGRVQTAAKDLYLIGLGEEACALLDILQ